MKYKYNLRFPNIFRHFFLGWLLAALLEYLLLPYEMWGFDRLDGIAAMCFPRLLAVTGGLGVCLSFLDACFSIGKIERKAIVCAVAALAITASVTGVSVGFAIALVLVVAIAVSYGIFGMQENTACAANAGRTHPAFPIAAGAIAVVLAAVMCAWTVARYLTMATPAFDFGIFAQMFYNMKATGLPMTTVERGYALSHFAVHVSPIYYLLLPVYSLFPDPITLQICQALVIASAVIPLWLIGRRHGLSGLGTLLLCAMAMLLPTVSGGVSYDIHENCFLLPLVLWLMYALDKNSIGLTLLFGLLTLAVKEDAAVYVAIAAVYGVFRSLLPYRRENRKALFTCLGLLVLSLLYFLAVTGYLAEHGDGVMTYRYNNFIYDGSNSLFAVVKSVLLCPMKLVYECADVQKHTYIILTLLPLLCMPILTRKYDRLLLLIPYLLINLMSDYQYQHDVLFQYNFGTTAFLLYLYAINLADLRRPVLRTAVQGLCAGLAAVCLCISVVPSITNYYNRATGSMAYYDCVRSDLDTVPADASVAASTFYVPYLSQRSEVYTFKFKQYCSEDTLLSCDYIVMTSSQSADYDRFATDKEKTNGRENMIALLTQNGYELYHTGQAVVIYCKAS